MPVLVVLLIVVGVAVFLPRSVPRITPAQRRVLERYFLYYGRLGAAERARFERLVMGFLHSKEWRGVGVDLAPEMQVMISASAAQLLFGLPDLTLMHFDRILVHDDAYRSVRSGRLHQGEVDPAQGVIRISWAHYLEGYARPHDAHNVALHEMAHALWFEDIVPNAEDDFFDPALLARWKALAQDEIERIRARQGGLLRDYAGTNQEEFFAVAVEYFFERPADFHAELPELYGTLRALLRQDPLAVPAPIAARP